jgi:serine phosphatase RsbU (regulator of sigma subunit)/Tfp pilus assembly protein PilF
MNPLVQNLVAEAQNIANDHARIDHINNFCWKHRDQVEVYDDCLKLVTEAMEASQKTQYRKGEAKATITIAFYKWMKADYDSSLIYTYRGADICKELKDWEGVGFATVVSGYCYIGKGNYSKAYELLLEALKLVHDMPPSEGRGWTIYAHGVFHFETKNYDESIRFYSEALANFEKININYGAGRSKSGIGSALMAAGRLEEAHDYISGALADFRKLNNRGGMSRTLNDMGVIMRKLKDYNRSEEYLLDSLRIRKEMNHLEGLTTTIFELGVLYLEKGDHPKALETLQKALAKAEVTKNKPKAYQVHHMLGEAYKKLEDPWKALEHYEKFYQLKSEVTGEQATNKVNQLQTAFATEKSEKEAEIHRLRNVELKNAFDEIALQNKIIEDKNRDITDSILYARRIQEAIIPAEKHLAQLFPESFVVYKPKDIVSGDFYWAAQTLEGNTLLAVADCTGHGVPGAFMSLLGISFLNEITGQHNIIQPDLVLGRLREKIIAALNPDGSEERKDGMDMVFCHIDPGNMVLMVSAANNPIWIFRDEVIEIRPDKFPVGKHHGMPPFTLHEVPLRKGDMIYCFTDGYADQFGGNKNKKFTYKRFRQLAASIGSLPVAEQKNILGSALEEWKGDFEQIDDICIVGVRV